MDLTGQLAKLFKPAERPHPTEAELSVAQGSCSTPKDFEWLDRNIPCQKACPAGTDIPAYLTAIAEERPADAYRINLRDNIFPGILGRVCSRPCESACRHGYEGLGEPVAICASKRSAADFSPSHPILLEPHFPPTQKSVAIIGSGVAGLAAARELALLGHTVTVYEKHTEPGGMLNQGIPEFRLPRELIQREIEQITTLGIAIHCGVSIGTDIPLDQLIEQHDAVIAAAGTLKPNQPDLPGQTLPGIRHGLDFLLEAHTSGTTVGNRVIVIGGGYTAMDCARTARRLGGQVAELNDGKLIITYRRTRQDIRVIPDELEELEHESIPLECNATPLEYLETDGVLSGIRFQRTGTDETFDLPADTVLLATGQTPDTDWQQTLTNPKLFLAGDYATGATDLISAIGHAKKTVTEMDQFLMGSRRRSPAVQVETATTIERTEAMDQLPRQTMPTLPLEQRSTTAEVETGYKTSTAITEAERCYRCNYKFEIEQDKCIKCDWCLKAKPHENCILMLKNITYDEAGKATDWEATERVREMNLIWINSDACTRCGACITACPVDAISLQKVTLTHKPTIEEST
jgi:formate dehydrogenase major subunit